MASNQKPDDSEAPKKRAPKKKAAKKKAAKKKTVKKVDVTRDPLDELQTIMRALSTLREAPGPDLQKDLDDRQKKIEAIHAKMQEFMTCFMIIGYLDDGTPVNIYDYENALEADALSSLLTKVAMGGPYG